MLIPIVTINICIAKGTVNVSSSSCAYLWMGKKRSWVREFIVYLRPYKCTHCIFVFIYDSAYDALTLELRDVCAWGMQLSWNTCRHRLPMTRIPFFYNCETNVDNKICKQFMKSQLRSSSQVYDDASVLLFALVWWICSLPGYSEHAANVLDVRYEQAIVSG